MLFALTFLVSTVLASAVRRAPDPCAVIGGQKWVAPADLRACFESFPVNETIKTMTLDTVERTLAFHTSTNYQIQAPEPYASDVHEDILADIARIRRTWYPSEFQMYIDLSESMKRLMDGHCTYTDYCYDGLFQTYLPIPLVLLTNDQGEQAVHIAPEAFEVASAEFADQISVWQDALPGLLKGNLQSLSGARVLAINGEDPFVAVNANAAISGRYQNLGARQNGFFAGYKLSRSNWTYVMGEFAQMSLPLADSVQLTVQRVNSSTIDTFSLPYRSRVDPSKGNFTDSATLRQNYCVATPYTNGEDIYEDANATSSRRRDVSVRLFQELSSIRPMDDGVMKQPISATPDNRRAMLDATLPEGLQPSSSVGGSGVSQFYMLDDGKTGVLALGEIPGDFSENLNPMVDGLRKLVERGATRLILDLTNNDGGYLCTVAFLHRAIAGPKNTTETQALLDTKMRAGPLAQLIVQRISEGADPWEFLYYNPVKFSFDNDTQFPPLYNWMENPVRTLINGREDAFSQRLGRECRYQEVTPPDEPLFDPKKILIVTNGRCLSSCSLLAVILSKIEGARTLVVGGKNDVRQDYAGTIGGQALSYGLLDTEIKSVKLKDHPLAPPDLLANSYLSITWRLAFGVDSPDEPEEWQDHSADATHPLTLETVNNPIALWNSIAASHF